MTPRLLRALATLRHADAARVDETFPAARRAAIQAAILAAGPAAPATPPARRLRRMAGARRRPARTRVAVPAFAALIAGGVAAVTLAVVTSTPTASRTDSSPVIHASPVSFRYPMRGPDSGDIIATVTDPFAAQSSLDAAFRAAGLDITISLVPASPSAVGTVVEISEPSSGPQIETLTGGPCVTGGGGPGNCPIGLKIPRDFTGSGSIALGRPVKPGEAYVSTNSAFAPGESLHCSGLIGATIAAAMPKLAARGITVQWQLPVPASAAAGAAPAPVTSPTDTTAASTNTSTTATTTSTSSSAGASDAGPPSSSYHIANAIPIRPRVVMLVTQADPLSAAESAQDARMYGAGC